MAFDGPANSAAALQAWQPWMVALPYVVTALDVLDSSTILGSYSPSAPAVGEITIIFLGIADYGFQGIADYVCPVGIVDYPAFLGVSEVTL